MTDPSAQGRIHGLPPVTPAHAGRRLVGAAALAIGLAYIVWRWGFTLSGSALWLSVPLVAAETFALLTLALTVFTCWRLAVRAPGPPLEGVRVAVMIATFDEHMDVLRPTVLGARAIRHRGPLEVWVLDDGGRPDVEEMCTELGARYLSRPAPRLHAKAGNINHGLAHVDAEFIVTLDADHVPRPGLLERTLGYFADPAVAVVQGPQSFFNRSFQHPRDDDPWRNEQSAFFDVTCRGKDRSNAAFWCGCPSVLRRSALMAVGGVDTRTVVEDCHTSLQLHAAGHRTVYHDEVLALGLAPEEIGAFVVQRGRWARGSLQMLRLDPPFAKRGLTWRQRVEYTSSCLYPLEGLQRLVGMLVPPVVLATGAAAVSAPVMMLLLFLPSAVLSPVAIRVMTGGRYRFLEGERFGVVRLEAYLRSLAVLVTGRSRAFAVTPKGAREGRPPVVRALRVPLAVAAVNVAALGYQGLAQARHLPGELGPVALAVTAGWAVANVALIVWVVVWARGVHHRRRSHRFPVSVAATYAAREGAPPLSRAHVEDLSRHGMGIRVGRPRGVGETVRSVLLLDNGPVTVAGRVAKVTPAGREWRVGVEFDDLHPAVADALMLWCFQHPFGRDAGDVMAIEIGDAVASTFSLALAEAAATADPAPEEAAAEAAEDRESG